MDTLHGFRRIADLLSVRDVRRLWATGALFGIVRWTEVLVLGIYTYKLSGSALTVAFIAFLNAIPGALFGAFVGTLGERLERRRMLLVGIAVSTSLTSVLAFLALTARIELWHIAIGTFLSGMMWTMEYPVRRTLLGEIAGVSRAPVALTFDIATGTLTMFLGPLLGGFLLRDYGLHAFYLMGCVSFLTALALVIPVRFRDRRIHRETRFVGSLLEGLRHVRHNRPVAGVLLITILLNFFGFSYLSMIPVIGSVKLELGAGQIGVLGSMEGAGAFVGLIVLSMYASQHHFMRLFVGGSLVLLIMIALFSVCPWYPVALGVLFVAGLGEAGFGSMQATITFVATPSEMRSRLMGLLVVCIGFGPLGILHTGLLAEWFGADVAVGVIAIEGLLGLVICLWCLPVLRRSGIEQHD